MGTVHDAQRKALVQVHGVPRIRNGSECPTSEMRYTTIIDISEIQEVYRNKNARLIYLHLALKAGYHDDDRDVINMSIRTTAWKVGLTVSATRHALALLERAGLLKRTGLGWTVTKWIQATDPTPRPKKTTTKAGAADLGRQMDLEIMEYQRKLRLAIDKMTVGELEAWLQELKDGRQINHRGTYLKPREDNIQWLTNQIKIKKNGRNQS